MRKKESTALATTPPETDRASVLRWVARSEHCQRERDTSWECLPAAPTRLPGAGLAVVQGSSERAHRKIE